MKFIHWQKLKKRWLIPCEALALFTSNGVIFFSFLIYFDLFKKIKKIFLKLHNLFYFTLDMVIPILLFKLSLHLVILGWLLLFFLISLLILDWLKFKFYNLFQFRFYGVILISWPETSFVYLLKLIWVFFIVLFLIDTFFNLFWFIFF